MEDLAISSAMLVVDTNVSGLAQFGPTRSMGGGSSSQVGGILVFVGAVESSGDGSTSPGTSTSDGALSLSEFRLNILDDHVVALAHVLIVAARDIPSVDEHVVAEQEGELSSSVSSVAVVDPDSMTEALVEESATRLSVDNVRSSTSLASSTLSKSAGSSGSSSPSSHLGLTGSLPSLSSSLLVTHSSGIDSLVLKNKATSVRSGGSRDWASVSGESTRSSVEDSLAIMSHVRDVVTDMSPDNSQPVVQDESSVSSSGPVELLDGLTEVSVEV